MVPPGSVDPSRWSATAQWIPSRRIAVSSSWPARRCSSSTSFGSRATIDNRDDRAVPVRVELDSGQIEWTVAYERRRGARPRGVPRANPRRCANLIAHHRRLDVSLCRQLFLLARSLEVLACARATWSALWRRAYRCAGGQQDHDEETHDGQRGTFRARKECLERMRRADGEPPSCAAIAPTRSIRQRIRASHCCESHSDRRKSGCEATSLTTASHSHV